jgi:hypothetical protein
LGEVFDVTAGAVYYGPGGGYHFFAGRDATRAFSTGDFTEEGLVANLNGLSDEAMLGLENWARFYRGGENDYAFVGYVAGGEFYEREDSLKTTPRVLATFRNRHPRNWRSKKPRLARERRARRKKLERPPSPRARRAGARNAAARCSAKTAWDDRERR